MLHARVAGLIAGATIILLAWNLSALSDAIRRFRDEIGTGRRPALPPAMGEHRTARMGFTVAGAALILLALLAPLLR